MEINFRCPLTAEELQAVRDDMLDRLSEWVTAKYPNIRLQTVERNFPALLEIKRYDDTCKSCMGVEQCPTFDGNRMNGRLDADGVVSIWMQPCPHGYKVPKGETCYQVEQKAVKRWEKGK